MNTVTFDSCLVPDCHQPRHGKLFDGKPYCREHYLAVFMAKLMSEHDSWHLDTAPSQYLKYMLGRFQEEFCDFTGASYLSAARVRDRGFDFRKTEAAGEFCITRHLNAWSDTKMMERVVECWSFDLENRKFKLVNTRDWATDDPE